MGPSSRVFCTASATPSSLWLATCTNWYTDRYSFSSVMGASTREGANFWHKNRMIVIAPTMRYPTQKRHCARGVPLSKSTLAAGAWMMPKREKNAAAAHQMPACKYLRSQMWAKIPEISMATSKAPLLKATSPAFTGAVLMVHISPLEVFMEHWFTAQSPMEGMKPSSTAAMWRKGTLSNASAPIIRPTKRMIGATAWMGMMACTSPMRPKSVRMMKAAALMREYPLLAPTRL
mmetsp:Transcript_10510/g.19047  ORF Transcript_10510/g.19047 Transcript_10510/m.19047 type:complete len:233 (+) Transcript_10510:272-970(+)